jgi:hypothetical protein
MESSIPEVNIENPPHEEKAQEEKKDTPVLFVNLAEDTPCK